MRKKSALKTAPSKRKLAKTAPSSIAVIPDGTFVLVEFRDHMMSEGGSTDPFPIRVPGWIVEDKDDHLKVGTWVANNELVGANSITFTVVKHPGVVVTELIEAKKVWKY
jgi:hypothetical protein